MRKRGYSEIEIKDEYQCASRRGREGREGDHRGDRIAEACALATGRVGQERQQKGAPDEPQPLSGNPGFSVRLRVYALLHLGGDRDRVYDRFRPIQCARHKLVADAAGGRLVKRDVLLPCDDGGDCVDYPFAENRVRSRPPLARQLEPHLQLAQA